MRLIWPATCLTIVLLLGLANAADQALKEDAAKAKGKAGVLEEKASTKGGKTLPTPAEIITKTEAQSVDPIGGESLDGAVTCLARTFTGRLTARVMPTWKPSPMSS